MRLIIEAPREAREALDAVFEPFEAREPATDRDGPPAGRDGAGR